MKLSVRIVALASLMLTPDLLRGQLQRPPAVSGTQQSPSQGTQKAAPAVANASLDDNVEVGESDEEHKRKPISWNE